MSDSLRKAALALFNPPFSFDYGYVYDRDHKQVADNSAERDEEVVDHISGKLLLRIRGWGFIQKIKGEHKPEDLQDEIGRIITESLTRTWSEQTTDKTVTVDRERLEEILHALEFSAIDSYSAARNIRALIAEGKT